MIAIKEAVFFRVLKLQLSFVGIRLLSNMHVFNSSVVGAVGIRFGLSFDSLYVLRDPNFF